MEVTIMENKNIRKRTFLTAGFILLFVWAGVFGLSIVSVNANEELSYEGSSTVGEGVMLKAVKVFEEKTKIPFRTVGLLGSGTGFKAVMEGKVPIGGMSRALKRKEKRQNPYYQIIGYDAIAIFVHDKNPIQNLSKDQVKGIFTGEITNWKELGGGDADIVVVTEIKAGDRATIQEFKKMALDGAEFGETKEIDKPHDCVKYIASDEYAITHASLAFNMSGVKALALDTIEPSFEHVKTGAYRLSRPLLLLAKELPKGNVRKFFEFILSPEGQAIVAEKFVPVRTTQ
jgi:phosphate transport system substrate-binding protein